MAGESPVVFAIDHGGVAMANSAPSSAVLHDTLCTQQSRSGRCLSYLLCNMQLLGLKGNAGNLHRNWSLAVGFILFFPWRKTSPKKHTNVVLKPTFLKLSEVQQ